MLHLDPDSTYFAGDWHGNTRWAVYAASHVARDNATNPRSSSPATILHLGDFAFDFNAEYIDTLTEALAHSDVRLFFLRGNHDDPTKLDLTASSPSALSSHIYFLPDTYRFLIGEHRVLVLGGAGSIDRSHRVEGVSWWPNERLSVEAAAKAVSGGVADVVLSHDAPAGTPLVLDTDFGAFFERRDPGVLAWCAEHAERVASVVRGVDARVVVHGHHHVRATHVLPHARRPVAVCGLSCDGTALEDNVVEGVRKFVCEALI